MNRRTSIYVLYVPAHIGTDALIQAQRAKAQELGVQVAGSWSSEGRSVVQFRSTDDATAQSIAEQMGGNTRGSHLTTGIGAHRRTVAFA